MNNKKIAEMLVKIAKSIAAEDKIEPKEFLAKMKEVKKHLDEAFKIIDAIDSKIPEGLNKSFYDKYDNGIRNLDTGDFMDALDELEKSIKN